MHYSAELLAFKYAHVIDNALNAEMEMLSCTGLCLASGSAHGMDGVSFAAVLYSLLKGHWT